MKKSFTFILLLLISTLSAQTESSKTSAPLSEGSALEEGISPERLNRIDAMLKDAIDAKQIPGAVALIARNGKIVFHNAYGMADEAGNAMDKDAIFDTFTHLDELRHKAILKFTPFTNTLPNNSILCPQAMGDEFITYITPTVPNFHPTHSHGHKWI